MGLFVLCFKSIFEKILFFYFKLIFFIFSDHFDKLMSKIIFKNKKIYYFDIFSSEKHFKIQLILHSETSLLYTMITGVCWDNTPLSKITKRVEFISHIMGDPSFFMLVVLWSFTFVDEDVTFFDHFLCCSIEGATHPRQWLGYFDLLLNNNEKGYFGCISTLL